MHFKYLYLTERNGSVSYFEILLKTSRNESLVKASQNTIFQLFAPCAILVIVIMGPLLMPIMWTLHLQFSAIIDLILIVKQGTGCLVL